MANVLGIDYGRKRIGVASADDEVRVATPLTVIDGRNDVTRDARSIADLGEAHEAVAFVVGLPLNMRDGSDSPQTELTRRFAADMARLSSKPVHLHDERLSSYAAHTALDDAGVAARRRRGLTDKIAAQKILQSYLDHPVGETESPPEQP